MTKNKSRSNEELVREIRAGHNIKSNMEQLYNQNLPLIRQFIKPFIYYEPEPDLLQQAYCGLWEAVQRYESSENTLFMTYSRFWILQDIRRYLEDNGSLIRIPSHRRQQIVKYKQFIRDFMGEQGRTPTSEEIADFLGVSEKEVGNIQMYSKSIESLDKPLTSEDEDFTVGDTVADGSDMEQDIVDRLHDEAVSRELWDIVQTYTDDMQGQVIRAYFHDGKSLTEIAREYGVSMERIRQIKAAGLRRLRMGKALRKIQEKCEIVSADIYRTSFASFKYKGSSSVESIVMRLEGLEEQYKASVL